MNEATRGNPMLPWRDLFPLLRLASALRFRSREPNAAASFGHGGGRFRRHDSGGWMTEMAEARSSGSCRNASSSAAMRSPRGIRICAVSAESSGSSLSGLGHGMPPIHGCRWERTRSGEKSCQLVDEAKICSAHTKRLQRRGHSQTGAERSRDAASAPR